MDEIVSNPALGAVKNLEKALRLLEMVAAAERAPTIGELAQISGLARPTAYRLLQTLVQMGYLQQDPHDGRLTIGYLVLPLAASLLDRNRLRLAALPQLQSLSQRIGERVNLGILESNRILILAGIEKPSLPTIFTWFGRRVPVHCCSLGKAILAFLDEEERDEVLRHCLFEARTPKTMTKVADLLADLARVRERGYAMEDGENSIAASCVAAPLLDARGKPIGAISASGRTLEPLIEKIELVCQTAELISQVV